MTETENRESDHNLRIRNFLLSDHPLAESAREVLMARMRFRAALDEHIQSSLASALKPLHNDLMAMKDDAVSHAVALLDELDEDSRRDPNACAEAIQAGMSQMVYVASLANENKMSLLNEAMKDDEDLNLVVNFILFNRIPD